MTRDHLKGVKPRARIVKKVSMNGSESGEDGGGRRRGEYIGNGNEKINP